MKRHIDKVWGTPNAEAPCPLFLETGHVALLTQQCVHQPGVGAQNFYWSFIM